MFDLIVRCIEYAIFAAFWIAVLLACRAAWRAGRARRYAGCVKGSVLVIALLWGGLFLGLTPGSTAYGRYYYSKTLFGRGFVLGSLRYAYYSSRLFNGDGYSIEVSEIPEDLVRMAASPPPEFRTALPKRPSFRSEWSSVPWHPTPIAADERKFLEFALGENAKSADLAASKALLERLANEPGHYIAYRYLMHGENVGNVDFYLLSRTERVFIAVNSNT